MLMNRASSQENMAFFTFFFFFFLLKLEKTCKGQNLFGVNLCVEGQVPDLPAWRLRQVPAFPTIALTELRVSMAPAEDKPTAVQWIHEVAKNDDKGEIIN